MTNLLKYPLEDGFKTKLSQEWDGAVWTMFLQSAPNFTFPAWVTTYMVVQPEWQNAKLIEIDSINVWNNTVNIINVTLFKGAWIANPTWIIYPTNTDVIISDNFQFWSDIKDAINSKLDSDWGNTTTTFDLQVSGSAFRIRLDAWDMKFTDDNNVEISLSTIAAAAWADRKVAISVTDTTPWELEDKLIEWDWISFTTLNPAWDEQIQVAIDLLTTNWLKFTTNQLDVEPATNTQVGTQRIATDAEAITWTLETVSINPKQAKDNYINKNQIINIGSLTFDDIAQTDITINHNLGVSPKSIILESWWTIWTTTFKWAWADNNWTITSYARYNSPTAWDDRLTTANWTIATFQESNPNVWDWRVKSTSTTQIVLEYVIVADWWTFNPTTFTDNIFIISN